MEIRNRLFPYPVLCIENDDYVDSSFYVECKLTEELAHLVLNFNITLENNKELQWLIREGHAEFIIHIECSSTAFRTIRKTADSSTSFLIPKARVNKEIALLGAIVAAKKISGFQSSHLNEDYSEEPINFEKGAILAYYNMPKIFVTKEYEELAGGNAFFTIIKRIKTDETEQNPVTYDINDAKIKILVDEEVYDEYIKFHTNPNMEALTGALLVMPALCFMLETIRAEASTEKYKPLYWYQKIKKACKLQGVDFENDLIQGEMTSVEIAQQLLKLPINRAFAGIARVIEE